MDDMPLLWVCLSKQIFTGRIYCLCKFLGFILSVFYHICPSGLCFWEALSLFSRCKDIHRAYLLWSYASCFVWLMGWLWVSNLSTAISTLLTTKEKEEVCVQLCMFLCVRDCVCRVRGRMLHTPSTNGNRWMEILQVYLKPISWGKCGGAPKNGHI